MDWIFEIPLWAVIVLVISLIANVSLVAFWWQARTAERQMRIAAKELQHQVDEFGKISRELTEIAQDEQRRCMRILDRVLTEREKEEISEDVGNYG